MKEITKKLIEENIDLIRKYLKRPSCPESIYKREWEGWESYLGIEIQKFKTPEEWVKIAEQLAKENGGYLPKVSYLQKGYSGLDTCMRTYPELFKHIKQYRRGKTSKEWVRIAENLAKDNNGILPNVGWLIKNKNSSLERYMKRHPELFKHIKQERKNKTSKEYIKIVGKLVKSNNGILQNSAQLSKEGYRTLNYYIRNHPELFKHIKQEKKLHTPEENFETAKKLIEENNGILPRYQWLIQNGHKGLNSCIKSHPEIFKGIKQGYKNGFRIL
jgi:hypothetical protein